MKHNFLSKKLYNLCLIMINYPPSYCQQEFKQIWVIKWLHTLFLWPLGELGIVHLKSLPNNQHFHVKKGHSILRWEGIQPCEGLFIMNLHYDMMGFFGANASEGWMGINGRHKGYILWWPPWEKIATSHRIQSLMAIRGYSKWHT